MFFLLQFNDFLTVDAAGFHRVVSQLFHRRLLDLFRHGRYKTFQLLEERPQSQGFCPFQHHVSAGGFRIAGFPYSLQDAKTDRPPDPE